MATCVDCKFFDLDAVKNSRGYIIKSRTARCFWESTEKWPVSVNADLNSRPSPGYVQAGSGKGCPCFQWPTANQKGE